MDFSKSVTNYFVLGLLIFIGLTITVVSAQAKTVKIDQLRRIHAMALHPNKPEHLFLGTGEGLFLASPDGQAQWIQEIGKLPVSMVHTGRDESVYAFVLSKGLMKGKSDGTGWNMLYNNFGGQLPIGMAIESGQPEKLFLYTRSDRILASTDGGKSWHRYAAKKKPLSPAATQGEKLYAANCQSCHGIKAVGESISLQTITDRDYKMAPALDGSAHAWHHTDESLVKTILEGSPTKGSRMQGFKTTLSQKDAKAVLAYFKSFWSERELDCQGAKHMQCM